MIKMKERDWLQKAQLISMLKYVHQFGVSERKRKLVLIAFCRLLDHQPFPAEWQDAIARFEEWLEGAASAEQVVAAKRRLELAISSIKQESLDFYLLNYASSLIEAGLPQSPLLERLFTEKSQAMDYLAYGAIEGQFQKGRTAQCQIVRDIFGNPFRPISFLPEWRSSTVVSLAQQMYDLRDFSSMPILADALGDADCSNEEILGHCRRPGSHCRGCWVCDLILAKC